MNNLRKIPLSKIPNQKFRVVLGGQNCTIHIYQRGDHLYIDLAVDTNTIMAGAICTVNSNLVQYESIHFDGCLFFIDKTGCDEDPNYEEFNARFALMYYPGAKGAANGIVS